MNPYTNGALHFRGGEKREMTSPVKIGFESGRGCVV